MTLFPNKGTVWGSEVRTLTWIFDTIQPITLLYLAFVLFFRFSWDSTFKHIPCTMSSHFQEFLCKSCIHSWILLLSCSVASDSLLPHGLPCPSPSPRACSNSCPLSWWCHTTISSSVVPFSSCLQSFPTSGSFLIRQFFASGGQSIGVQLRHQSFQWIIRVNFFQDWLVGSPCSPMDSQEASPKPQFKTINSSVLSLLYSPALTSIHDYWKNYSFD